MASGAAWAKRYALAYLNQILAETPKNGVGEESPTAERADNSIPGWYPQPDKVHKTD